MTTLLIHRRRQAVADKHNIFPQSNLPPTIPQNEPNNDSLNLFSKCSQSCPQCYKNATVKERNWWRRVWLHSQCKSWSWQGLLWLLPRHKKHGRPYLRNKKSYWRSVGVKTTGFLRAFQLPAWVSRPESSKGAKEKVRTRYAPNEKSGPAGPPWLLV